MSQVSGFPLGQALAAEETAAPVITTPTMASVTSAPKSTLFAVRVVVLVATRGAVRSTWQASTRATRALIPAERRSAFALTSSRSCAGSRWDDRIREGPILTSSKLRAAPPSVAQPVCVARAAMTNAFDASRRLVHSRNDSRDDFTSLTLDRNRTLMVPFRKPAGESPRVRRLVRGPSADRRKYLRATALNAAAGFEARLNRPAEKLRRKRYVNPSAPDEPTHYFGTIKMSGAAQSRMCWRLPTLVRPLASPGRLKAMPTLEERLWKVEHDLMPVARRQYTLGALVGELDRATRLKRFRIWKRHRLDDGTWASARTAACYSDQFASRS